VNLRTFFRLSLLLPILVLGLFEMASAWFGEAFRQTLPSFIDALWVNARIGVEMGWLQYTALSLFLAWGFGRWPLPGVLLHGTLGPLYYAVIMLVTLFAYAHLANDPLAEDIGIFMAILSVTYGYLYVGVILGAYYLLKQAGALRSESQQPSA
jgi:hypothetical protein